MLRFSHTLPPAPATLPGRVYLYHPRVPDNPWVTKPLHRFYSPEDRMDGAMLPSQAKSARLRQTPPEKPKIASRDHEGHTHEHTSRRDPKSGAQIFLIAVFIATVSRGSGSFSPPGLPRRRAENVPRLDAAVALYYNRLFVSGEVAGTTVGAGS